ncbi:putative chloramphenicol 3-O phosphotransferase [Mobilicoccus pelagius NBRC 104925]|uniref:Putative chloramphenicol 3-O phosphotransferase n=1 Tax=Mobilicoccus pelagius NBRC 104925 TaxID=1089455 RepID=H5UUC3_9MICO|nr:putative chloramphenicol 3-O phosphotransferase [Mobilicoccus pelagius NBRC 104925]
MWLRFSVDTLIEACPAQLLQAGGLDITDDGTVDVGDAFTRIETCWMAGIAATARAGAHILLEDGFLSGPAAQARWRAALDGLTVAWVGVRLAPGLAAEREARRGDRAPGMAAAQATSIHEGIDYDLEINTATGTPTELAQAVAARIAGPVRQPPHTAMR